MQEVPTDSFMQNPLLCVHCFSDVDSKLIPSFFVVVFLAFEFLLSDKKEERNFSCVSVSACSQVLYHSPSACSGWMPGWRYH